MRTKKNEIDSVVCEGVTVSGYVLVTIPVHSTVVYLHSTGPVDNYLRHNILDETVTRLYLLANGWEAKWSFNRGNREKTGEPSYWGTSDYGAVTAPWQLCKVYT